MATSILVLISILATYLPADAPHLEVPASKAAFSSIPFDDHSPLAFDRAEATEEESEEEEEEGDPRELASGLLHIRHEVGVFIADSIASTHLPIKRYLHISPRSPPGNGPLSPN